MRKNNRNRIKRSKKNKKVKVKIIGTIQKTKKGSAFLMPEDGSKDIYISAQNLGSAMNGDRVAAISSPTDKYRKSPEGKVVKIIDRANKELVGTFKDLDGYGFILPDDRGLREDIYVGKRDFCGAKDSDKVVCQITKYPGKKNSAEGKVTEILGDSSDMSTVFKALERIHGVRVDFPQKVVSEAKYIPDQVTNIKSRVDLRDYLIFTIDGRDAKDFDDAVSIHVKENGNFILGVHIADVGHYVKEDSYLDKEAYLRGTSIYTPGQVIPMLPPELSNGVCSLQEGTDKYTISLSIEITSKGKVLNFDIYESIINSKARLYYNDVSDFLEYKKDSVLSEDIQAALLKMNQLAEVLSKLREKRGSIDFDLKDPIINLGFDGVANDIFLEERRSGERLIEEFMLLSNELVAKKFFNQKIPFIYRVHEKPDKDKMKEFIDLLRESGIKTKLNSESVKPSDLQKLLKEIKGHKYENIIKTSMLRSMRKAYYSTEHIGHFALALVHYSHFTSPIRRYPDLAIHRIIKESLRGPFTKEALAKLKNRVIDYADRSSKAEIAAVEYERDVIKIRMAEYMQSFIGKEYDVVISGVSGFGIFVELKNGVEGLVHIDKLGKDYYEYDKERHRLKGISNKKIYSLGDMVRVKLEKSNPFNGQIDFSLIS